METPKKTHKVRNTFFLILTALIWGAAFVAQSVSMDYIEPLTFIFLRSLIGGLFLIPCIWLLDWLNRRSEDSGQEAAAGERRGNVRWWTDRQVLTGGIVCGLFLFFANCFQQTGIQYTTVGKAGFITTLYVVIVPIISVLLRKRVRPIMWLCVVLGAVGLYLLCMTDDSFKLAFGDMLVLLCAVAFAVHIMVVDHFAAKLDGTKLSCIQFLTSGILGLIGMAIFESPDINAILDCWLPILYAGVLSCGLGYTFQVIAQKYAEPTVASLLMSLESVFAVISGAILLHETMSMRELTGCAVIFAAVIISQLPEKKKKEGKALQ